MCTKLKELIPRQMFEVAIQASLNGRIIARTTVKLLKKMLQQSVMEVILPGKESYGKSRKRVKKE